MRDWVRRHPVGFQAIFVGVLFPLVMWVVARVTGWPGFVEPRTVLGFIGYWLTAGTFIGAFYYGFQLLWLRLLRGRMGS
jgi:hypothetical protein